MTWFGFGVVLFVTYLLHTISDLRKELAALRAQSEQPTDAARQHMVEAVLEAEMRRARAASSPATPPTRAVM